MRPARADHRLRGRQSGRGDGVQARDYRAPWLAPEGCKLIVHNNRHDFGLYRTLALRVDDEESEAVDAYAEAVEPGLETWIEAGFTAPVAYVGKIAKIERSQHAELVIGALLTTRPSPDGTFPVSDFATLHGNLAAAFPEQAEAARQRLTAS
ncbi:hypothetical protein [Sphingomonas melonis]|uniref:hypothetical protein n=1 Tax=Sphingomonas melonis TaxID=152682 RepID=UPI000A74639D